MRYPQRNTVCISSQAGLWHGVSVLRHRPGRIDAQPVDRPRSSNKSRAAAVALRDEFGPIGCPTWCSWAWGSRWPITPGCWPPCGASPRRRRTDSGFRPARSRCPPSVWRRRSLSSPTNGSGVTLALSLHAPDDDLRDTLVPVNTRWKVSEALDAAKHYADVTGRRVSIEYALIRDVNDQPWRAELLGKRLHRALGTAGAREFDSAQSDARQPVGRQPQGGGAGVRPADPRAGCVLHGARYPRPGDQRRLRTAGLPKRDRTRVCGQVAG